MKFDLEELKELAEAGNAEAQYRLGVYYYRSEEVIENQIETVKWFRKAAEQELTEAQLIMGLCY